jgi:hypothetical protein
MGYFKQTLCGLFKNKNHKRAKVWSWEQGASQEPGTYGLEPVSQEPGA